MSFNVAKLKKFKNWPICFTKEKVIFFWGAGRIFNIFQDHVNLKKYKSKVYVL